MFFNVKNVTRIKKRFDATDENAHTRAE